MAFVDGSVVHVALPAIQAEFGSAFSDLQWIVNGYTLTLGALLLAGGALGDQSGRRRIFAAGIAVFALASIACALAPGAHSLIASRVVQGIGAAMLVPQSLAIIAASFPRSVRGRAIGTWAAFSALTTAAGPALGGVLIDAASWRAVFWINVPLAAGALYLTLRRVPESRSARRERVDWYGAALATASLGALTFALTRWPQAEGAPGDVLAALAAGLAAAAAFVRHVRRVPAPLVPPELFRSAEFSGLNVMTLLLYAALGGALFLLPYNLIQLQGYSATEAGLALVPLGLMIGVLSRYSGRVSDRIGPRPPLIAGALLVAAGCAGLALPGIGGGYVGTFFVPILLIAAGMGTAVSPLTTAVMNAVPDDRAGSASGVNNAASRIAGLLAVALSGAIATAVFTGALETRLEPLDVPAALERQMLDDAERLAELEIPAAVSSEQRPALRRAIDDAFLGAFRAGALLNAVLAAVAAGIAAVLFRRRGPQVGRLSGAGDSRARRR
ncbi:MAG: MFS transporter [Gammaproteobacteria bacterium]|nr:MFS transporter [Gammaproteobacteria bacterium]